MIPSPCTISIKETFDPHHYNDAELASYIKNYEPNRQRAWDFFIIWRNLKPGINAKDFYKLYDNALPWVERIIQIEWHATHYDTLLKVYLMAEKKAGYTEVVWQDGMMTGSEPSDIFIERLRQGRYISLFD